MDSSKPSLKVALKYRVAAMLNMAATSVSSVVTAEKYLAHTLTLGVVLAKRFFNNLHARTEASGPMPFTRAR